MRSILLAAVLTGVAVARTPAQTPALAETYVAAGAEYRANALQRLILGAGWRDLWITPLRLPVADLSTLEGGLVTERVGGGTTTATLHVRSAAGRSFVFRTVNKDPLTGQLEELTGTLLGSGIRDQISAFNPVGALVTPGLLEAVGVLHVNPRLFVFPDLEPDGSGRRRFAGRMVLFEERPDDPPDGVQGLGGHRRFVSTERLFERLRESPSEGVAVEAFLRARLVDLLVGDRDRSVNNWRWAGERTADGWTWHPIPRDRDQAFLQMDGVIKRVASFWEPRLVRFSESRSSVRGLSRNAWDMDRRFLVELDQATWEATTRRVIAALSDDVMDQAALALPPEMIATTSDLIAETLKRRRGNLPAMSAELFDIVNREAVLWASDEPDSLSLRVGENGSLDARIYRRGASDAPPYRVRVFEDSETDQARFYLLGGDDRVVVHGAGRSIDIRLNGGSGADSILIGDDVGSAVTVYDGGSRTAIEGNARWVRRTLPTPILWDDSTTGLDFGGRSYPLATVSYSGDLGLVLGGGIRTEQYDLERQPYRSQLSASAGYSFGHSRGFARASYRRGLGASAPWLLARGGYSGVERLRFYGFGNETSRLPVETARILHEQWALSVALGDTIGEDVSWSLGPSVRYTRTDTTDAATLLAESDPYGAGAFAHWGLEAAVQRCVLAPALGIVVRGRRLRCSDPTLGSLWSFRGSAGAFRPIGAEGRSWFTIVDARVAGQLSLGGRAALAARVGGRSTSGDVPFHEGAFVGGSGSLRGYSFERFLGNHSLFGNAELRGLLATLRSPWLPVELGLLAQYDVARVWLDGESSSKWHSSAGGGVWIAPLKRGYTVHVLVSHSIEGTTLNLASGFAF